MKAVMVSRDRTCVGSSLEWLLGIVVNLWHGSSSNPTGIPTMKGLNIDLVINQPSNKNSGYLYNS